MPVVKGSNARRLTGEAIVLDLGDLQRHAQRLRESAQREADAILAEGRSEAERLVSGADARGFAEGFERGVREGTEAGYAAGRDEAIAARGEEIDALLARWNEALERWNTDRLAMIGAAREELLALALRVARRIVLRVTEIDPDVAVRQTEAVLELAGQSHIASVRVHPEDLEAVSAVMPALLDRAGAAPGAEVVADESVDRGGVIVRTRSGEIDARIDTQLQRIVDELIPDGER